MRRAARLDADQARRQLGKKWQHLRPPKRLANNNLAGRIRNFIASEDGPTAVEYAVMLALIIVVCIAAVTTLGSNANSTFSFVGSAIKPS